MINKLKILLITAGGTIVQGINEDGHAVTIPFDIVEFEKTSIE